MKIETDLSNTNLIINPFSPDSNLSTDSTIQQIELQTFKQNFKVTPENKQKYGEVNTPFHLINTMLDMLPKELFQDDTVHWLDPACGSGYFPMVLYNRLMVTLINRIKYTNMRHDHILQQMLSMVEINHEHIPKLFSLFGSNSNVYHNNFLSLDKGCGIYDKFISKTTPTSVMSVNSKEMRSRLVIIGNPPYNCSGLKKVPTNTKRNKKQDGKTIWTDFVRHSIDMMEQGDYLIMIVPSIWMKPDKAKIYDLLTSYKLHKIRTFTNTETAKLFKYQAQTPTCIFVLEKKPTDYITKIYDKHTHNFIEHRIRIGRPLPLCEIECINFLLPYVEKYGHLKVHKTNMPSKNTSTLRLQDNVTITQDLRETYSYNNIRTCCLVNGEPVLKYELSDKPCPYHGKKKVVLAHKMYGHPIVDITGYYGISNRDNYVVTELEKNEDYYLVAEYLRLPVIQRIYNSTRYRMRYLERYAFEFIPNIIECSELFDILRNYT